jgi:hypothetical protein
MEIYSINVAHLRKLLEAYNDTDVITIEGHDDDYGVTVGYTTKVNDTVIDEWWID